MAKNESKKKTPGVRNDTRPNNGKKWSKKKFDDKGRALTGRGKPSGHSIKGVSLKKITAFIMSHAA